jgi:hypothetical protein
MKHFTDDQLLHAIKTAQLKLAVFKTCAEGLGHITHRLDLVEHLKHLGLLKLEAYGRGLICERGL